MLVKLAGIDTTSYKLSEVKGSLDQKELTRFLSATSLLTMFTESFLMAS